MATTTTHTIKKDLSMYPAIDGTIMLCDNREDLIKLACYLNSKSSEILSEVMTEMLQELQQLKDEHQ